MNRKQLDKAIKKVTEEYGPTLKLLAQHDKGDTNMPKKLSKGGGNKFDGEKLRVDLVPVEAIEGIAEILTHGAAKYGDNNWREGIKFTRVYGAMLRHLLAWYSGEDIDKDSGLKHLDHAACNIAFLQTYVKYEKYDEYDDRIKFI